MPFASLPFAHLTIFLLLSFVTPIVIPNADKAMTTCETILVSPNSTLDDNAVISPTDELGVYEIVNTTPKMSWSTIKAKAKITANTKYFFSLIPPSLSPTFLYKKGFGFYLRILSMASATN